jgi:hypothetical protein
MKRNSCKLVAGVLLMSALTCLAAKREDVDLSVWRINGTAVSATAAQLNTLGPLSSLVLTNVTQDTGAVTATAVVTPQAPGAVTPTITVTAQRPGAQTPTITVTPQAPATVTPTITVTKETGAVTASGANSLVTITNYFNPVQETVSLTDTNGVTALVVTNVTWSTAVYTVATNGVIVVSVVGGDAVMTNATAVSSALPDFITNMTAVSSALLDYPTNATASCSALPNFPTNATVAVTVTGGDAVVTNITVQR